VVKNGKGQGQQLYRCKDCRHQFFDNGKLPRMRKPKTIVAAAFRLCFDGSSLRKVGRSLREVLGTAADQSTIWRWTSKLVPQVDGLRINFTPRLSGIWHVDETTLRFRPSKPPSQWQKDHHIRRPGKDWWQWDAIDRETRFVVGTRISKTRTFREGLAFLMACSNLAPRPQQIITDGLPTYDRVIRKVFFSRYASRKVEHMYSEKGFRGNQLIERWHGTLEDRISAMRGLKSPQTVIPRGIAVDYNFLRPHLSLGRMTPAQAAQIDLPFNDGWGDLITWATVYRTLCQMKRAEPLAMG